MKITKKDKKAFLKNKLSTSETWAKRALIKIYDNQTIEEQCSGETHLLNGIGFNGADAEVLTSFAKYYKASNYLSDRQLRILFRMMPKYWGQILAISDKDKLEEMIMKAEKTT